MNKFFSKLLVVLLIANSAAHATSAVHPDQLVQAAPASSLSVAAKAVQNWAVGGYGPLQLVSGMGLASAGILGFLMSYELYRYRPSNNTKKNVARLASVAAVSLLAAVAGGALIYKGLTA